VRRPLFPDAEKPPRVNPWEYLGMTIVGAAVIVLGWLFLNRVLQ
jgi:hypothetical protein